jgi:hypothetical protein
MALFTAATRFMVFMDATAAEPTQQLEGRELLAPVFDNLNTYAATMHFKRAEHCLAGRGPGDRRELLPGPSPLGRPEGSAR